MTRLTDIVFEARLLLPMVVGPGDLNCGPGEAADILGPLLKIPLLVIPIYPDTLLLPATAPGRVLLTAGLVGDDDEELTEIASEWRRFLFWAERGIVGGGGMFVAECDRVSASAEGLLVCAPLFRRASSALVGVIAMASLKSISGIVGNAGSMLVRSDGAVLLGSGVVTRLLRSAASL